MELRPGRDVRALRSSRHGGIHQGKGFVTIKSEGFQKERALIAEQGVKASALQACRALEFIHDLDGG
jgi:hypothetical protein